LLKIGVQKTKRSKVSKLTLENLKGLIEKKKIPLWRYVLFSLQN